jgi:predicted NAD-dependent protein-ADP-ribosyltransferase YbiA (DUF1768 family)
VLLDDTHLREWDGRKQAVMRDAMHAKFSRHETLRTVLLATLPAYLWHGNGRGQQPIWILDLESIRDALRR